MARPDRDPATTAAAIRELLLAGHTVDLASERGVTRGWTRADVMAVVRANGWELDRSGRIPLRHRPRPAVPARPHRRLPDPVHVPVHRAPAAPAKPRKRPARPALAVVPEPAQVQPDVPVPPPSTDEHVDELVDQAEPPVEHQLAGEQETDQKPGTGWTWDESSRSYVARDEQPASQPVEEPDNPQVAQAAKPVDILARGLEHPHPAVRARAKVVARAIDQLIAALDRADRQADR